MKPGEIYITDTEFGPRPMIVVSREELNRGNYVVGVLCTSARFSERSALPNCVPFKSGEFGFTKDRTAQAEAISFFRKADIHMDEGPIGMLTDAALRDLIRAIGYLMDADCEPL